MFRYVTASMFMILILILIGCEPNYREVRGVREVRERTVITIDEKADGKEIEVPIFGWLEVNLPCDYLNGYTWELSAPYTNDEYQKFRVDNIERMNEVGRTTYIRKFSFLPYVTKEVTFVYYKKNTKDNLADPKSEEILKKIKIKIIVLELEK